MGPWAAVLPCRGGGSWADAGGFQGLRASGSWNYILHLAPPATVAVIGESTGDGRGLSVIMAGSTSASPGNRFASLPGQIGPTLGASVAVNPTTWHVLR